MTPEEVFSLECNYSRRYVKYWREICDVIGVDCFKRSIIKMKDFFSERYREF